VANFVRRLKKGSDKYKGKLPLSVFNCDGVGHFVNKCPYKKNKRMKKKMTLKGKFKRVEEKKSF